MGARRNRGRHRARPQWGPRLRRAAVVLVASVAAVLGVSAAGVAPPPQAAVDHHFLAEVRGHGHPVAVGADEALVVSAARKLCERRDSQTYVQRRAATLTSDELAAVKRSFGDDSEGFIALATDAYCS
jgi:hypothetical protein